jgi:hypothetical protein
VGSEDAFDAVESPGGHGEMLGRNAVGGQRRPGVLGQLG